MSDRKRKPIEIGAVFGRLTVVTNSIKTARGRYDCICVCECGRKVQASESSVKYGGRRSCGCLLKDHLASGRSRLSHGHSRGGEISKPYASWRSMMNRCTNPNVERWPSYGGRGIKVCLQWQTFGGFWADMETGWQAGLSLERIDVDGNYEPGNCTWIPLKRQSYNRTDTLRVAVRGEVMPFHVAMTMLGLSKSRCYYRIKSKGMTHQQVIDEAIGG